MVFSAALWLLQRELHGASVEGVIAPFRALSPFALAAALGCTAVSYLCLGASEWWAITCIGRRLDWRRIELVTFVSYALSNGLGLSVATGGAARLRFYRGWGFSGAEVAAVTFLAGLAVTLSGFVTAGAALLLTPALPRADLGPAILMLAPAGLWFVRLPASSRFLPKVRLATPAPAGRAAALAGALADWAFSGLALFLLLPSAQLQTFGPFLAVFVLGSVVSAASGVPGGIGVFEAVVLTLSRRFALPHETAAALILYRLIYAIGPLCVAAAGLGVQQLRAAPGRATALQLRRLGRLLAPPLMGSLLLYAGGALVLVAANAPIPLEPATQVAGGLAAGRLMSSLIGALLILLGAGLWRRLEGAYVASLALLGLGAALELWKGFGLGSAAPLLILALLLAPCRFAFPRRSSLLRDLPTAPWFAAAGMAGAASLVLSLVMQREPQVSDQPWWAFLRLSGRAGPMAVAGASPWPPCWRRPGGLSGRRAGGLDRAQ